MTSILLNSSSDSAPLPEPAPPISPLEYLRNCVHLKVLDCSNNNIASLKGLENCRELENLTVSNNNLTSLAYVPTANLRQLQYSNNQIEFIPPNVNNFLRNASRNKQSIYSDSQSVHNHEVQETVRKSISNVINIPASIPAEKILDAIMENNDITPHAKEILAEYCTVTESHSTLHITFQELLAHVYSRIIINEHAKDICGVLSQEMMDSECKCFTGRMSRLVNSLSGFDDLVQIRVADAEQIGNIVLQTRFLPTETEDQYNALAHRERFIKEMRDREFDEKIIGDWVEHIPIDDEENDKESENI